MEIYQRNQELKRGDRSKGGVDWYRLRELFLRPYFLPFMQELRTQGRDPIAVMDNAPCHRSIHTKEEFCAWRLTKLLWPPNSPDLNAIEHAFPWVRQHVSRARPFPITEAETQDAWLQMWRELPQPVIDRWIEALPRRVEQVIENKGDNNFHG